MTKFLQSTELLDAGWIEYCSRKAVNDLENPAWYRCKVICFDNGEPVIKTWAGHYHRRPVHLYVFRRLEKE